MPAAESYFKRQRRYIAPIDGTATWRHCFAALPSRSSKGALADDVLKEAHLYAGGE
jgi:hypothetical protein